MSSVPASYGQVIATRYSDCVIPLTGAISGAPPSEESTSGISHADLTFIANHVSLSHELNRDVRDMHGRLDEKRSLHDRRVVVDDLLASTLTPCAARRFSVVITHDVDRTTLCEPTAITKRFLRMHAHNLRETISAFGDCRSTIARSIDELLQFEIDSNIRSIFFFLSGPYSLTRYGSRTSARWSSAQGIIRSIKATGMEVGLHGSYYALENGSYDEECRRLTDAAQTPIRHHRNHYLRYDPKCFWRQLSEAGIRFDHSVGFTNGWGLRTGTCIPYPAYDFSTQSISDVVEVPMLVMDGAWTQKFDHANINKIRAVLEAVHEHRGCVGINFHPESLATSRTVWEYFRQIIGICRELGADMMTTADSSP